MALRKTPNFMLADDTKNRATTKNLSALKNSDVTDEASLRFDGTLVIGKRYEAILRLKLNLDNSRVSLSCTHDGSTVATLTVENENDDAAQYFVGITSEPFIATATSLTTNLSVSLGSGGGFGNIEATDTSVTLRELNNEIEGSF